MSTTPNPVVAANRVGLERTSLGVSRMMNLTKGELNRLSKGVIPLDSEFQVRLDWATRSLILQLRTNLLRSTISEEHVGYVAMPATWWQHFKQDQFPAWLLRRFPVQMKQQTYTYETNIRVCPHSDTRFPDDRRHIDFITAEDPLAALRSNQ